MDSRLPRAQALTIKNGCISGVGTDREILSTVDEDTVIRNLDGAVVLPGFTDCHTHLVGYALELFDADLRKARSIFEIQDILRKQTKRIPSRAWLLGHGWDQEKLEERRFPDRFDLDAAVLDKPVCIFRVCEHICAVNSLALQLANITAATSAPAGGVIDRDEKTGEPTGILQENVMNLVLSKIPARTDREVQRATTRAIQRAVAAGLTSIHCVVDQPQHVRVLQAMNRSGMLKVRIYLLISEDWLHSAADMGISTGFGDKMLKMQAIKIFTDGSLGARTAALEKPYFDAPHTAGVLTHSQDELDSTVQAAARSGLQVAIHAIGDRAIAMALTALEKANLTIPQSRGLRHRVEHASVLNPGLISRIKRAGVVASVQPHFMVSDPWVPDRVGPERARFVYNLRSLTRAGITTVGGSDCPVEPIVPLESVGAAAAGVARGYGECVDPRTAVEMFTKNAAYASHEEEVKGTIQEGKIADLVVLERDPLKVPPSEIHKIRVLATIVGGRLVYVSKKFRAMKAKRVRVRRVRKHA